MVKRLGAWRKAGAERKVQSVTAEQVAPQLVRITAEATLPVGDGTKYRTIYNVYGSGDIVVEASMEPGGRQPAGTASLRHADGHPGPYSTVTYLGRGPYENYWDRHTGSAVGLYSGSVEEMIHVYTRPQENGNRTDVRWLTLTDNNGTGLLAVGMPLLSVSAWPLQHGRPGEGDAHQRAAAPGLHHAEPRLPADGRRRRRQLGRPAASGVHGCRQSPTAISSA